MSFCAQDLSVLAYANGFTHWHYRTRDSFHDLIGQTPAANDNSYFAAARESLRPGDQITINLLGPEAIGLVQFVVAAIAADGQIRLALVAATSELAPAARAA